MISKTPLSSRVITFFSGRSLTNCSCHHCEEEWAGGCRWGAECWWGEWGAGSWADSKTVQQAAPSLFLSARCLLNPQDQQLM